MKKETFNRIKKEFPIIYTAAVVSLFSGKLYYDVPTKIFSWEMFNVLFEILMWALIASGIIYGIWLIIHKLT